MENVQQYKGNIFIPNLLNICVDRNVCGEVSGRLYHCYSSEPILFANIIELIREAEKLFDTIAFPQASTKTRSFVEPDEQPAMQVRRPEKVVDPKVVTAHKGELVSFVTNVRFRQNSTWQGEFFWVEQGRTIMFSNTLDFIKQIDAVLEFMKR